MHKKSFAKSSYGVNNTERVSLWFYHVTGILYYDHVKNCVLFFETSMLVKLAVIGLT